MATLLGEEDADQLPAWVLWFSNLGQGLGGVLAPLALGLTLLALRDGRRAVRDTRRMVALEVGRRDDEIAARERQALEDSRALLRVSVTTWWDRIPPAPASRILSTGTLKRQDFLVVRNDGRHAANGLVIELTPAPGDDDVALELIDEHHTHGRPLRPGEERVIALGRLNYNSRAATVTMRWYDGSSEAEHVQTDVIEVPPQQ